MRVLFLENEDSFSWNIVEALPCPRESVVVRPGRAPGSLDGFDAVVLGSGPTDPSRAGLVDLVLRVAQRRLPLLGVCLGHQAVGLAFGARLVRVRPAHGVVDTVRFDGSRLFAGFAEEEVMRYHSLALERVLPPLRVVATSSDGLPMAVEHEVLPIGGLQFHPDSYASPAGRRMVRSFFEATR